MQNYFEHFETPWHIVFAIIGLLFILISNIIGSIYNIEGILIILGWLSFMLCGFKYYKYKKNNK